MNRCVGQQLLVGRWDVDTIESKTAAQRLGKGRHFDLPTDLCDWVHPHILLGWIGQEVGKLNWDNAELVEYLRANPDYQPRITLTLLALAYLTQVYSSEEIAKLCHSDPAYKSACSGKAPFVEELSSFRRKNRVVIERILARTFQRAICHRFNLEESALPPELGPDLRKLAVERLNIARHMDA